MPDDLCLPGFANVHSHAFQRMLRGGVQRREPGREDTFWTWRETMYGLANRMDLEHMEAAARLCYVECLEAGYTAVGEFHYLHHAPGGAPWPDPQAASEVLFRAARQTGIRLTLLWTVYAQGGFGQELGPHQIRFGSESLDTVRRALDTLEPFTKEGIRTLGLALHSVRAVPRSWLAPLAEEARTRGLVLHAHVSEQMQEVRACREATGSSPVALLQEEGVLGPQVTAVHATWIDDEDVELLRRTGTKVCLCPSTEGDLGDGFPPTAALHAAGVPLCIGSDSHALIDPFYELRALEYQARASTGTRCVLVDADGSVAPALEAVGHRVGYEALGLMGQGDRVWLDGGARALEGTHDPQVSALMAGHPGLVRQVEVAGEVVVRDGRHVGL